MYPLDSQLYTLALAQGVNAAIILAVVIVLLNSGSKN
jgi:hypothetical protein